MNTGPSDSSASLSRRAGGSAGVGQPARRREAPQQSQRRRQLLVRDAAAIDQLVEAMPHHGRADAREPHQPAHGLRSGDAFDDVGARCESVERERASAWIDSMKCVEFRSASDTAAVHLRDAPGGCSRQPRLRPSAASAANPSSKTLAMRLRRFLPDETRQGATACRDGKSRAMLRNSPQDDVVAFDRDARRSATAAPKNAAANAMPIAAHDDRRRFG